METVPQPPSRRTFLRGAAAAVTALTLPVLAVRKKHPTGLYQAIYTTNY